MYHFFKSFFDFLVNLYWFKFKVVLMCIFVSVLVHEQIIQKYYQIFKFFGMLESTLT